MSPQQSEAQCLCSHAASAKIQDIFQGVRKANYLSVAVCRSLPQSQHQTVAGRRHQARYFRYVKGRKYWCSIEETGQSLAGAPLAGLAAQALPPRPRRPGLRKKCKPGQVQKQLSNNVRLGNWRFKPYGSFSLAKLRLRGPGGPGGISGKEQIYLS